MYKIDLMKLLSFLICITVLLSFSTFIQAQSGVGINTTNPRKTLEVAGDMKISGATTGRIKVTTIRDINATDVAAFLIQDSNNYVKDVTTNVDGVALAYFQQYRLSNMLGDWITDFETNIDASKYVLVIVSAYFDKELLMLAANQNNFATPFISAFTQGGTWHIAADYATARQAANVVGTWVVDTVILSRAFSKIIATQTVNINDGTSGVKSGLPIID